MRRPTRHRSLIASLAYLVCLQTASAGSMSATPIIVDKSTAPDTITLPDISITFGNSLYYSDTLTISIAGAEPTVADGYPSMVICEDVYPAGSFVIGYVSITADRWIFRVAAPSVALGVSCKFGGLKITRTSMAETCELTSSYEATTFSHAVIDVGGPIVVATVTPCGPPPPKIIEVGLDIKPGLFPNTINASSSGSIPVAILSSESFYAPGEMDLTFPLTFGGQLMQPNLVRCNSGGEDVNSDGFVDLVCHFATSRTGFQPGDTLGFLVGKAVNGAYVAGSDSVQIVK